MSLVSFFWRYFRRRGAWAGLALASILVFATTTTVLVSLIEPIFGEVLLAGDQMPGALGVVTGAPEPAVEEGAGAEEPGSMAAKLDSLRLTHILDGAYRRLKEHYQVDGQRAVYFVPILFVVVFLVRSIAGFVSGYSFQHIGLGVTTDIRNDLYGSILRQSSRFYAGHPSGELVSRVVNDVAMMQNAVSNRLLDLFQQSITLVFLVYLLLSTHFRLAVICMVVAPALVYPIVRFGKGMRKSSHRSQERMADLANLVAEGVRGHRVVKAFGMEEFEEGRFREATRRHLRVNLWAQILSHLSSPVVETLAVLGTAALLIYSGLQIRAGELSAPVFVEFLGNLLFMYDPIRKLNKVNLILQQSLAAAQRVESLMATPNEVVERPDAVELETIRNGIEFRGVSFAYDHQYVLEEVDLRIGRGEIVALVGPSGAGKTTLVNLLPRFFDPDAGSVRIDDVDLRDLTLESLRGMVGIVTQETILFDDSVRANIAYGRSDLPMATIRQAAEAAYADEFIRRMPEGYDTVIGEGGLRLSGGQRQRLAIARALLKNPPILILDEATSQLDSESEALVQKALYHLMEGRTTLVIAHRLATVSRADRIVVMESGRVVEEGDHEALMSRGGTYKRLHDLQFQG